MKLQRLVLLVLGLSVWMAGGCRAATIGIFAVQGNSDASPLQGQAVTVEGIVTGDFQGPKALRGFFIQDAVGDGDAATSDGVFVYVLAKNKKSKVDVSPGDRVRVSGTVSEYRGLTQIGDITTLESLGRAPLPVPVALELPLAEEAREKFEGMLVRFPQPLTISGSENLRSYGELSLAQGGRLFVPTNGQGGTAQGNAARRIILDDGSIRRSPQPVPYLASSGTRRAGDTVQDLVGVLSFSHGAFRVHPTQEPRFKDGNPRPTKPQAVGGTLRVASFNVENYFTTLKSQNAKARGATTPEEFARKTARLVATLKTLDADVLGLIEMENNGSKAVDFLTAQLNDAAGANTYAAVADPPGGAGTDLIKVAILYKPAKVQPVGAASALSLGVFDRFPIAQTFRATATPRARFSVVVNHFKSKSGPPKSGDVDAGAGRVEPQAHRAGARPGGLHLDDPSAKR
jgi:predicted extracellular nuclease